MRLTPRWTAALVLAFATLGSVGVARADTGAPPAGVLATPTGLSATTSIAGPGVASDDPDQLRTILRAVSAVDVTAHFHADKDMPRASLGPLDLAGNADVTVHAHVVRKPGESSAVLDSLDIDAKGASLSGHGIRHVSINSKGEMSVKLDSWVPTISIKSVERKSDGSVVLHSSWWLPNVKIGADGKTKVFGISVGKVDPKVFAHWPPSLDEISDLLGHDAPKPGSDTGSSASEAKASPFAKLAGTLDWKVNASVVNDAVAVNGKLLQGGVDAHIAGTARLAGGKLTTIGDANTVSLSVKVAPQDVGDANTGARIDSVTAKLDGKYHLEVPLDDPGKSLKVDFDGHATYAVSGSNVRLALPDGAKLTIGGVDTSGDANISLHENAATKTFTVSDDGSYVTHVTGPIRVQNVGPVKSLDLDGGLTSTGTQAFGPDGLAFHGNLKGQETVRTNGIAELLEGEKGYDVRTTVTPGSNVQVNADDARLAVRLDVTSEGGIKDLHPHFGGASADGTLDGKVGLDGATVHSSDLDTNVNGSANVGFDAPFGANLTPDGKLVIDPNRTSATLPVELVLHPGTQLDYRGKKFQTKIAIDREGSSVKVTGKVVLDPDGKPRVQELDDADVFLTLGPGAAVIGGKRIGSKAEKTVRLKGRVVFRPHGLDVYGSLTVGISGDNTTPILSIDY